MKNEDDYLWDRSGEPDPEIQELEQLLGTLRYQPRPLDIPAGIPSHKRASFPRFLAIAATILVTLLGVGLWLALNRQAAPAVADDGNRQVTKSPVDEQAVVAPVKENGSAATLPPERDDKANRHSGNPERLARASARRRRLPITTPELTADELKEAIAAKEQLMLALRVASSKLSFAQKKAQEINTGSQVHNQHKSG